MYKEKVVVVTAGEWNTRVLSAALCTWTGVSVGEGTDKVPNIYFLCCMRNYLLEKACAKRVSVKYKPSVLKPNFFSQYRTLHENITGPRDENTRSRQEGPEVSPAPAPNPSREGESSGISFTWKIIRSTKHGSSA